MRVIFCDSVVDNKTVDPDYQEEWSACKQLGIQVVLISHEELTDGNINGAVKYVPQLDTIEQGIYRGWMLTPNSYQNLYEVLLSKNIKLINSPEEYRHCHYLPESYSIIADLTPQSVWTKECTNVEELKSLLGTFKGAPIIVKDFVKSEKHDWKEACFIPDSSNWEESKKVIDRFVELRGSFLNKGLVFRKFEELQFLTNHSQSDMPLTKEFRTFFKDGKPIMTFNYWDEGDYGDSQPILDGFLELVSNIKSNFFTMDIAQKENGEWIIMELGDGQVAGIPELSSSVQFYKALL